MTEAHLKIVLASTSVTRRSLLEGAGVEFHATSPGVDEEALKASLRAEGMKPFDQADKIAEFKALAISRRMSGIVIGADQMLVCEGAAFDKVGSLSEARDRLSFLRGKTHHLATAVVLAREGMPIWRALKRPSLTMRPFSDAFLDAYLEQHGEAALGSVGCYQLEGAGAQLFSSIDGDYFSVLGLPLLELLDALRSLGAVRA